MNTLKQTMHLLLLASVVTLNAMDDKQPNKEKEEAPMEVVQQGQKRPAQEDIAPAAQKQKKAAQAAEQVAQQKKQAAQQKKIAAQAAKKAAAQANVGGQPAQIAAAKACVEKAHAQVAAAQNKATATIAPLAKRDAHTMTLDQYEEQLNKTQEALASQEEDQNAEKFMQSIFNPE